MPRTRDKYDVAVDTFLALNGTFQSEVARAWLDSKSPFDMVGAGSGCLVMIRAHPDRCHAATPALTAEIAADERLPTRLNGITRENLPVFAEWQRRLDREPIPTSP